MSTESIKAIKAIKQAESQGEVLCRVAEEKAAEMRANIRAEGESHCKKIEAETAAEYEEKLKMIREKAAAITEKKRAEAEAEAQALAVTAHRNMPRAVKLIVWGIVEKCQ